RRATGAPPIRSFTLDFHLPTGEFRPDELRSTPDLPFAHAVVERLGTDHTDITLEARELSSQEAWRATLEARDLPPLGDMDTSFYLLCKEVRRDSIVALSGGGPEDVFGGHLWLHDPNAVVAETFPWLAASRRLGRSAVYEPRPRPGLDVAAYQAD